MFTDKRTAGMTSFAGNHLEGALILECIVRRSDVMGGASAD